MDYLPSRQVICFKKGGGPQKKKAPIFSIFQVFEIQPLQALKNSCTRLTLEGAFVEGKNSTTNQMVPRVKK